MQVPAGAPAGQRLATETFGCAQCHDLDFADTWMDAGAAGADFAWFTDLAYNHTHASPEERRLSGGNLDNPIRMGNFSRRRLPELLLQQIWEYISVDLGLRAPLVGRLAAGVGAGEGMTYTLTVENEGIVGKGPTAEYLAIALILPSGSTVVNATGAGYQGVSRDPQSGADVAVWTALRMAPQQTERYTITLSAPAAGADRLHGVLRWSKPVLGDGGDSRNINPPPAP